MDVEDALRENGKVAKRMFSQQEQDWVREHEDGGFAQDMDLAGKLCQMDRTGACKDASSGILDRRKRRRHPMQRYRVQRLQLLRTG